ncbi:septum site-determining protein Ssd [Streptomyces sp. NPDC046900]|uniref:septum site-determining protein Ssd n=1 Tax=Streptomyces sp. NPDC046900 TaxID=3155473 RepID=UPI0033C03D48
MAGAITRDGSAVAEGRRSGPLIVTEDAELLDDLLRLCAAAGARPEVHPGVPRHRGSWEAGPLVLVGDDAACRVRGAVRRRGVVLVGRDQGDSGVWRRAVEIGADHVLLLPDGEQWLVDRIADVAEGVGRPALTVGVIGGRGGAGASTLACALAVTSAREGRHTLLVDADPLGGGLDVLLGGETTAGLRWAGVRRLPWPGRRRRSGGVPARAAGAQLGPRRHRGGPAAGGARGSGRGPAARRCGRRRPAAPCRRGGRRSPRPGGRRDPGPSRRAASRRGRTAGGLGRRHGPRRPADRGQGAARPGTGRPRGGPSAGAAAGR